MEYWNIGWWEQKSGSAVCCVPVPVMIYVLPQSPYLGNLVLSTAFNSHACTSNKVTAALRLIKDLVLQPLNLFASCWVKLHNMHYPINSNSTKYRKKKTVFLFHFLNLAGLTPIPFKCPHLLFQIWKK